MSKKTKTTVKKLTLNNVPSPSVSAGITDVQESDWNVPFESAFVLVKEIVSDKLFMTKASFYGENSSEIYGAIEMEKVFLQKKSENDKSNAVIIFYGSRKQCKKMWRKMNENGVSIKCEAGDDNLTSKVQTIDLTDEPTSKRPKLEDEEYESDETYGSVLSNEMKLDLIIQYIADINERLNYMEEQITSNASGIENLQEILIEKSNQNPDYPEIHNKPRILIESELKTEFIRILVIKRATSEWTEMIKTSTIFDDLTPAQASNVKKLILDGSLTVGSFMRSLAKELFSEEKLRSTMLGVSGKGAKLNAERNKVFSIQDELKLKNILKLIDEEFFSKKDAYEFLVRSKINSYGSELRRTPKIEKRKSEKNDITRYFKKVTVNRDSSENCHEPIPGPSTNGNPNASKLGDYIYSLSDDSSNEDD